MGIADEFSRLNWRIKSYTDFVVPQSVVFGFFATHNLGDEGGLLSFKNFCRVDFPVIAPQTYRRIPDNLKIMVVGLGGAVNQATAGHVLRYLSRIPRRNFPCVLVSGGVNRDYGEPDDFRQQRLFKDYLSLFDFLSFRDRMSQRFAEVLGFQGSVVIPDMVLSLPYSPVQNGPRSRVGLVLASNNSTFQNNRAKIMEFLVAACDDVIETGREIVCIPFQIDTSSFAHKQHSEVACAREIQSRLRRPERCIIMEQMLSPLETLRLMDRDMRYVISMRLHGNVFSAKAGVPFICLSYNDKQNGFLEMMGKEDLQVPLQSGKMTRAALRQIITKIEENYTGITTDIQERVNGLQTEASGHLENLVGKYPVLREGKPFIRKGENKTICV